MKRFNIMYNIGRVKYVVNFHNGAKKHADNSDFFDMATFKSKKKMSVFISKLLSEGYIEEGGAHGTR